MAYQFNPFTGTFDIVSSGGGVTIGNAVSGGINNTVLYIDGSGNLACNADFSYDATTLKIATANGASPTPTLILYNSDIGNIGNLAVLAFNQKDILGFEADFGQIRIENIEDATPIAAMRFYTANGSLKEIFRTWTSGGIGGVEALERLGVNIGALPSVRLEVIETDPFANSAVVFQGYSDGGFVTREVLRINNSNGDKMVAMAGANLVGAGDYGNLNLYGTATAAQDGYSFGDFTWVNISGEGSSDLRMGNLRIYRDGAWNQGSFQIVLRNAGSFAVPLNVKYSSEAAFGNNSLNYNAQVTVTPWDAFLSGILVQGTAGGYGGNYYEARDDTATLLWSIYAGGQISFDTSVAPAAANQLSRSSNALQFHDGTAARSLINKVRKNSAGTIFSRSQINLIEGTNVTLTVADDAGNDEIDVTINSSGGAGASWTSTEIDFGTTPQQSKTFVIVDAAVSGASKVIVVPNGSTATGRVGNDYEWEAFTFSAVSASGQFTLAAICGNGSVVGKRKVFYTVA